jgi:hypothetical protein
MHLLELYYANTRLNQTGKFIFPCHNGTIPKWTILSSRPREREKLQLMALTLAGTRCLPRISYQKNRLLNFPQRPLQLEFYLAQHPETEGPNTKYDFVGHGLQLYDDGRIQKITKQECRYLASIMAIQKIRDHSNLAKHFMLAYGPDIKAHRDSDDFDFNNPYLRISRFYSLFDGDALLTDPVVFLEHLHKKPCDTDEFSRATHWQSYSACCLNIFTSRLPAGPKRRVICDQNGWVYLSGKGEC